MHSITVVQCHDTTFKERRYPQNSLKSRNIEPAALQSASGGQAATSQPLGLSRPLGLSAHSMLFWSSFVPPIFPLDWSYPPIAIIQSLSVAQV